MAAFLILFLFVQETDRVETFWRIFVSESTNAQTEGGKKKNPFMADSAL